MSVLDHVQDWRSWLPVPTQGYRPHLSRWVLLEGNRYAVTAALLLMTFTTLLAIGMLWTFELSRLLTETEAVQTVLTTFLSGIILLVSIVVSINSIVLSYDITHINAQEERIEGTVEFRREIGQIADDVGDPSNPSAFLQVMAEAIGDHAEALKQISEESEEGFAEDIEDYHESLTETVDRLEQSMDHVGGEFGVLWLGLEADYGTLLNHSRWLTGRHRNQISEAEAERFDDLVRALELFATGREYFKTLYYGREISELSRTLLIVSLPAIIVTSTTILAINAQLFPDVWLFGLPPLLTFVAATFTIAIMPFIVLTAFMLRVATVARRTTSAGPFVLGS